MAEGPILREQITLMNQILQLETQAQGLMTQKHDKLNRFIASDNPQVNHYIILCRR